MESRRSDGHWSAVAVVSGVFNSLEIDGEVHARPQRDSVVGLQDFLIPVVERAVAKLEAQAAGGQIRGVHAGDGVDDAGQTHLVVSAAPPGSLIRQPQ